MRACIITMICIGLSACSLRRGESPYPAAPLNSRQFAILPDEISGHDLQDRFGYAFKSEISGPLGIAEFEDDNAHFCLAWTDPETDQVLFIARVVKDGAFTTGEVLWPKRLKGRSVEAVLKEIADHKNRSRTLGSNRPNQSLEPTATAVTPRADERGAPAVALAHH